MHIVVAILLSIGNKISTCDFHRGERKHMCFVILYMNT